MVEPVITDNNGKEWYFYTALGIIQNKKIRNRYINNLKSDGFNVKEVRIENYWALYVDKP